MCFVSKKKCHVMWIGSKKREKLKMNLIIHNEWIKKNSYLSK